MKIASSRFGFTLVELMVVVSVIGILASIIYANFGTSRAAARDDIRKSNLEEVRLALELYKAQYGVYPLGCNGTNVWSGTLNTSNGYSCETSGKDPKNYIEGLTPDFLPTLPWDQNTTTNEGYLYRVSPDRLHYKFMAINSVEQKFITSLDDPYARCPQDYGTARCGAVPDNDTYAVYSPGAAGW